MDIAFQKITAFPRGTLVSLLTDAYSFEPQFERNWREQWQEFDDFFYDNPHIAESCGFMTVLERNPIGFVTWDPTELPESAEIGHNCILTQYKGNGYGKRQMQEAVRRILALNPRRIIVWTNEICVPAQHTYEGAGFRFVGTSEETFSTYAGRRIHYEIVAQATGSTLRELPLC